MIFFPRFINAGRNITEVIKQTPTPITRSSLMLANPLYLAIMSEPKPAIVVNDVNNTALPVLRMTTPMLPGPSMRYLWSI